jgi:hypothetical protein
VTGRSFVDETNESYRYGLLAVRNTRFRSQKECKKAETKIPEKANRNYGGNNRSGVVNKSVEIWCIAGPLCVPP